MKIPKYIEKLINRRANLASQFREVDNKLSKWIEDNGIELDGSDYYGGVESLMNPWDSTRRVEQAIKDK